MLIILLIIIVALMFTSFTMANRDIMSPSVLTCAGYFAAVASCLYNTETWSVNIMIENVGILPLHYILLLRVKVCLKSIEYRGR